MITRSMVPEYLKYILPTMLTFTMAGIYGVIDGVFVGHAVGDAGLAGVNVAYPLVCLILAAGTGLGMGGGVISSIARGKGEGGALAAHRRRHLVHARGGLDPHLGAVFPVR